MSRFITVDLNGWLDHLVDEHGRPRALGFRSCLYRHGDTWLFGAQALAAARKAKTNEPLFDAFDALTRTTGYGTRLSNECEALSTALWQLAADATRHSGTSVDLALVIPDDRCFGSVTVEEGPGPTALEALYNTLERLRPRVLARSRVELVWRSVAALQAVVDQGNLGDESGAVLVISVNRRILWTVLELRRWSRSGRDDGPIRIVRSPVMEDCEENEAWTTRRMRTVEAALDVRDKGQLDEIRRWTRWIELLATGMRPESLKMLGIDAKAIEHRSWPKPDGGWEVFPDAPSIDWTPNPLPVALRNRIQAFRDGKEGCPLAIVFESPVGLEMTAAFEGLVRKFVQGIPIFRATGASTAQAAVCLAAALGRDPDVPAWLDEVSGIEVEVRERTTERVAEATKWMSVVPGREAIPAGQTYHTRPDPARRVTLAPGIEHIHLHLRRGRDDAWDERYSGKDTGHRIRPSDHVRIVEPLARMRPLSGEARIEIVEHLPDGGMEALDGSRASVRWSEMSKEQPEVLRSIPELYIFEPSEDAWENLKTLLRRVVEDAASDTGISTKLKDELYKCTQSQWNDRKFPLGSDGQPPRTSDPQQHRNARELLVASTEALLSDLERAIRSGGSLAVKEANRLHMPLTWFFTGCPERTVEILLDAIENPEGSVGRTLHMENQFSAWSIYQGVGRAARSEETLRTIFDTLIGAWEHEGGRRQNKFLLAAATHPMARRAAVRRVLDESHERFERVKRFLYRQLENLLDGVHDPRPQGRRGSLELRYVTMGYRGLCQVRYAHPDWFPVDGEDVREAAMKLRRAQGVGRDFERKLVERTAPYLTGEGEDPSMPGGF